VSPASFSKPSRHQGQHLRIPPFRRRCGLTCSSWRIAKRSGNERHRLSQPTSYHNLHTALCLGHDCNPDAARLVSLTTGKRVQYRHPWMPRLRLRLPCSELRRRKRPDRRQGRYQKHRGCCCDDLSVAAVRLSAYKPALDADGFEGFHPLGEYGQRRAGANSKYRWQKDPGRPEWQARPNGGVVAPSLQVPDANRDFRLTTSPSLSIGAGGILRCLSTCCDGVSLGMFQA
jgi:hypothetical protein